MSSFWLAHPCSEHSGFTGLSDSFAGALWLADWALTLAYRNFSEALLHVGGRDSFYSPFIVAPTNQSSFRSWTVGSPYYTLLAMAETFGSTNASRVVDLSVSEGPCSSSSLSSD